MTDLDHKRQKVRGIADKKGWVMVIYTDPDDFEPKVLLDAPEHWLPAGAEVIEKHYPKTERSMSN